ncbi:MAG: hypothetical protein IJJ47_10045 [Methanosphaera sp.]|nr:hypothetical protein [Methanosphaera sp.]
MKTNNLNQIVDVTGNEEHGFNMYVDGVLMWNCETRQDVFDQVVHACDCGFFSSVDDVVVNF